jgi:hypothetical protein
MEAWSVAVPTPRRSAVPLFEGALEGTAACMGRGTRQRQRQGCMHLRSEPHPNEGLGSFDERVADLILPERVDGVSGGREVVGGDARVRCTTRSMQPRENPAAL